MIVRIASPLRSYTQNQSFVQATGGTVAEVLDSLEAAYPGIRFRIIDEHNRIRQHMKLFLNADPINTLTQSVTEGDTVHIIAALSGG